MGFSEWSCFNFIITVHTILIWILVLLKSAQGSLVLILVTFTCYVSVCIFCSKHGVKFYKMCRVLHNQKGSVQINACDKSVRFVLIVIIVDHNWARSLIKLRLKFFLALKPSPICQKTFVKVAFPDKVTGLWAFER